MALQVDLAEINDALNDKVATEMESNPEVVSVGIDLDLASLPIEARRWIKVDDVVVVVADLRNSTQLAHGRKDGSLGAIYEAAIGGITQIFDNFEVDYFQAQGDGGVAIFWGEDRYARAICAAITIKTFSQGTLVPKLNAKFGDLPETGYKIGIASGDVLVKKVGKPRDLELQTPVWARNPVNYAAKCAQQTDVNKVLVTASVWGWVEENDYIALSCGCKSGVSDSIWKSQEISNLRPDDDDRFGRVLSGKWCENCGEAFCNAVLEGKTKRDDVKAARVSLMEILSQNTFERAVRKRKVEAVNTQRGLRRIR